MGMVDELKKVPGRYTAKVFSRKPNDALQKDIGVPLCAVDFDSVKSIQDVLEKENVHTVISTIGVLSEDAHKSQLNLLRASELSGCTRRFVPSTFDVPYNEHMADVLYTGQYKLDLEKELMMTTSLEWTRYHNGFYMDYFFSSKTLTYLTPGKYVVDLDAKKAIVPGDGTAQITFTHTMDVAKFVVASLGLAVWPTRQFIIGDQLSWNQLIDMAEKASEAKFERQYNSLEVLRDGDMTHFKQLEGWEVLYDFWPRSLVERLPSAIQYYMASNRANLRTMGGYVLNEKFPSIRTLTLEDALSDYYS